MKPLGNILPLQVNRLTTPPFFFTCFPDSPRTSNEVPLTYFYFDNPQLSNEVPQTLIVGAAVA